jgi:hypothetical protein
MVVAPPIPCFFRVVLQAVMAVVDNVVNESRCFQNAVGCRESKG